ncbi:hypothetical protein SOCE26_054180 [Sorangium cellulosum]|uniref:Fatty acid desaturase domain-containing protein n=1 Tax=Sorangium cellulosum TaxID=56 RepID=A0A2L0EXC4_SORCE|nr:acyl-CoA desaturase [Sorangium cellulosum]AUX43961.1 hypothetical protein SOCE26_054180 [Sorangium cellulosum]
MTPHKARVLDSYVSAKILAGPSASAASRPAAEALRGDVRYQRLRARLEAAGLLEAAGWSYTWRVALIAALFAAAFALLCSAPAAPLRLAALAVIGFALVQGGFLSHEAMHGAISRRPAVIQAIGQTFDTLLVGLAFSYFRRSHELHHFHCNEIGLDPDTQSSLWSVAERPALEKRGLGALATRHQAVLIPLLAPLWGLQLKWDSMAYVARNLRRTRLDQLALLLHAALWFGVLPWFVGFGAALVDYLGWLAVASVYMFLVIPINHVARANHAEGDGVPFLDQQVLSTRNIRSSPRLDFFFMGQNSHIEHHLFPQIPASRLRLARPIVREVCIEEGLPYEERGLREAFTEVFARLNHLGRLAGAVRESRRPWAKRLRASSGED